MLLINIVKIAGIKICPLCVLPSTSTPSTSERPNAGGQHRLFNSKRQLNLERYGRHLPIVYYIGNLCE